MRHYENEIIALAERAGFGCNCDSACAYAIALKGAAVGLPRASGIEALERFEGLLEEGGIATTPAEGNCHYWWFTAVA